MMRADDFWNELSVLAETILKRPMIASAAISEFLDDYRGVWPDLTNEIEKVASCKAAFLLALAIRDMSSVRSKHERSADPVDEGDHDVAR